MNTLREYKRIVMFGLRHQPKRVWRVQLLNGYEAGEDLLLEGTLDDHLNRLSVKRDAGHQGLHID